MKMFVDEATGYLIIDEIEEGIDILPTALYQGYLKQISDLQEKVSDLQDKLAVAQVDASVLAEQARTERGIGIAVGLYCAKNGLDYTYAKYYYAIFNELYSLVENKDPRILDGIETKYKYLLPENS
jgi:hypothetical protein